ncbi:MAG: sugar phosphate isomerase/epimerase [Sedimentisphaerales bacterium]|nr:sugar phosphate isomerase/epimerase [Sedimentisphaerales bacterium]
MKLSVAIAGEKALPSAFVVFRGFENSIRKASMLGYDGIELALKNASEIDPLVLKKLLVEHNMEVSCISTGQVFADLGLMFTDPEPERRRDVRKVFTDIIDLAENFGQMVNIGRVRGRIGNNDPRQTEELFIDMASELCDYAAKKNVVLLLEPVNRYEIDFINSVQDAAELALKVNKPNFKLMPDVFHMNIEDKTIGGELARHIKHIGYVHLADSNRLAPGQGHTDFDDIFKNLSGAGYKGWVSVEILPKPAPDVAAKQALCFLKPFIDKYK